MLLGVRPWARAVWRRVGVRVTRSVGVGRGPLASSGGGRALVGAMEAGSRPCAWAGGLGNRVGLPQDP